MTTLNRPVDQIIPFRVIALALPPGSIITLPEHLSPQDGFRYDLLALATKLGWKPGLAYGLYDVSQKVWTVAGIKKDEYITREDRMRNQGDWLAEKVRTKDFFLLVRAGEVPIWWPAELCEVVE